MSPDQRQAVIWTHAGISLIGPLGTKFREILIKILTVSFKKMAFQRVVCAMATNFCLRLNALEDISPVP